MPVIDESKKLAWLEKRRKFVTGTDAAAILGISKWSSPLSVWRSKRGEDDVVPETEAMYWGKKLERSILERYAEVQGCDMEYCDAYELRTSPEYPRLGASLDGFNRDLGCPVDAKNVRVKGPEWGDEGSDGIPDYYRTQLAVQMAVTGAPMAHLAVLFSGQEFRIYQVMRDDGLIAKIAAEADRFWERVESGEMPEPTGCEADTGWLKSRFADGDPDATAEATPEILSHAEGYREAAAREKAAKEEKDLHANAIKARMGEASAIPGVCTWKNAKDGTETDWKAVAQSFASDPAYAGILELNTRTKKGVRRFVLK